MSKALTCKDKYPEGNAEHQEGKFASRLRPVHAPRGKATTSSLKFAFNGVVRRISIASTFSESLDSVRDHIRRLFGIAVAGSALSYHDDEHEKVAICSDVELHEAFTCASGQGKVLKILIETKLEHWETVRDPFKSSDQNSDFKKSMKSSASSSSQQVCVDHDKGAVLPHINVEDARKIVVNIHRHIGKGCTKGFRSSRRKDRSEFDPENLSDIKRASVMKRSQLMTRIYNFASKCAHDANVLDGMMSGLNSDHQAREYTEILTSISRRTGTKRVAAYPNIQKRKKAKMNQSRFLPQTLGQISHPLVDLASSGDPREGGIKETGFEKDSSFVQASQRNSCSVYTQKDMLSFLIEATQKSVASAKNNKKQNPFHRPRDRPIQKSAISDYEEAK
mmetsp:Transcript_4815/g.11453  ORF Transcript_4815/g.11453 Transcript_4815/m.11453 type:complete len:392 (-) Transcript_4815:73-1248(-)